MSADTDTLHDAATRDLEQARVAWVEARQQRQIKDSPGNRRVEEAAWLDVEAALEMWDESRNDCE